MKLVYVAGPFRGPTAWDVEQNVRRAEVRGFEVAQMGAMPLIPHANTRFFNGTLSEEFWLEGTLALLRKCDAVILVERWLNSKGTLAEIAEAKRIGLPVFTQLDELAIWLEAQR